MRIEFLGTGGAIPTPRPGCNCRVCAQARTRGLPYTRSGPALFVHGPNLLIDTPEDIVTSLNRANIPQIDAVIYSHWHPDHTAGLRVFESLNLDLWSWPMHNRCTPVYIPQQAKADFDRAGLTERLEYHHKTQGVIEIITLPDGEPLALNGVTVEPYKLPAPMAHVYAFILSAGRKRVLLAPDELDQWQPDESLGHFDVAVLPSGIFEFNAFTGERQIPADHPVLKSEATFRQTLDMVRALNVHRVYFTHIGPMDGNTFDDLVKLQGELKREFKGTGKELYFAFDRLVVSP